MTHPFLFGVFFFQPISLDGQFLFWGGLLCEKVDVVPFEMGPCHYLVRIIPWLVPLPAYKGGDPNHLLTWMIIQVDQVVVSRVKFTPRYRDEKPSFPYLFSTKLYPTMNLSAPNMNQPKYFNPMDSKEFLLNLITCWIIQLSLHPCPPTKLVFACKMLGKSEPNSSKSWAMMVMNPMGSQSAKNHLNQYISKLQWLIIIPI